MKQTQDSEGLIERFLLGELSVAERAALENGSVWSTKARYDQVCRIEDVYSIAMREAPSLR